MIDDQRLAQVFAELADTLVYEFDVVDFLQTLTERCVELLDVEAAGLMLADHRGNLQVMAASVEPVLGLELLELQNDEGPCLDCFASGEAIINIGVEEAARRWPVFVAAATENGFHIFHALPMRLRGQVIGAVNLFSVHPGKRLTEVDAAVGQGMADVATIGLLHERAVRERDVLAVQLQTALDSRVLIEQAKGVLAERAGITVTEAFTLMRSHARRHGAPLTDVATAVINRSLTVTALLAR